MRKANYVDMCEGPLLKNIILYTIPVILTGILQMLFNAADLIVVGRFCGSVCVAAVGSTEPLVSLIINLFIGISIGAGVAVAQAIGSGDGEEVRHTVHCAIPVSVICGLILTVVGFFYSDKFLLWMGTPSDVIELSGLYMRIYSLGMTANMVYNFCAAILCSAGDTKNPLYILTLAGAVNVVLNVILVTLFGMDVDGVAIATVMSQILSAVLVVIMLMRREDSCRLNLSSMHLYGKPLIRMIRTGLPAGIQGSLFSISNVIIQAAVNSFDSAVVAGSAAAGNIDAFIYFAMHAFNQTAISFNGQNTGAGKLDRVSKATRICLACVFVEGLVLGVLTYIFAKPLLSVYITDSPAAIEYGICRILYLCVPYFLCGMMETMNGAMRGIGMSMSPTVICVFGSCVLQVAWIYTVFRIPQFHSISGLFLSYPVSWLFTFALETAFFLVCMKRIKKRASA